MWTEVNSNGRELKGVCHYVSELGTNQENSGTNYQITVAPNTDIVITYKDMTDASYAVTYLD